MWVKFPKGAEGSFSVERQSFSPEHTETETVDGKEVKSYYCRVPDHFVPQLQAIGFSATSQPEGCELEDLPKADPERDTLLAEQAGHMESLRARVEELTTNHSAMSANLGAVMHERDELRLQVHELTQERDGLKARLEELGISSNLDEEATLPKKK